MARTPAPSTPTPSADLVLLPLGEWLESHQRLASLALGQWAGWQELWLRGVSQQLDAWNALWRIDEVDAGATPAWWGPWLPMLRRGGEQLA